jgi:hypothetical protein
MDQDLQGTASKDDARPVRFDGHGEEPLLADQPSGDLGARGVELARAAGRLAEKNGMAFLYAPTLEAAPTR